MSKYVRTLDPKGTKRPKTDPNNDKIGQTSKTRTILRKTGPKKVKI